MIRVGIVGASGFTGLELVKILLGHPEFELAYVSNTEGNTTLDQLHPALKSLTNQSVEKADPEIIAKECDLVFLALPHQKSMGFAKELLDKSDIKIVDLSADYRLELETYEANYCPHEDSVHLEEATYGLPELYREEISQARLIANPGCYPTAALLALMPFTGLITEQSPIFIDAKSGVSGAGKKCIPTTHFATVNDNIFPYAPMEHRHGPEITEKLNKKSGKKFNVCFVPTLIPVTRGMLVSCYFETAENFDPMNVLEKHYANEKLVRIYHEPVSIKNCVGTHFCDIFAKSHGKGVFVSAAIDNLLRGASSQAIANANLICGLDESLGLPLIPYLP